jgi:hypothetical protein
MKLIILILLSFAVVATAQTNNPPEFRILNGVKYDVNKPPFITVTIPAGAALANALTLHYNPASPTVLLKLQIPAIYRDPASRAVIMEIANFPYSPTYFRDGYRQIGYKTRHKFGTVNVMEEVPNMESALVTKSSMALRLFPKSPAHTNYTATGAMVINPARPYFDYGKPVE